MSNQSTDTTFAELAHEYGLQAYELATFLDLGTDYAADAELTPEQEAEYRDILEYDQQHNRYEG